MQRVTDPTMAALDAAVKRAVDALMSPFTSAPLAELSARSQDVDALIAAAEARGAARASIDPATLALARLGAAYLHDGTRHPVHFWKEVTLAQDTPGVRERIAELLSDTNTETPK
jgi:transcriptional regulator GlxA family with amidase domain